MTSSKSYLIAAIHQWLLDSELTPYLEVELQHEGVSVPSEFQHQSMLVLDLSPSAIRGLSMTSQGVAFTASFEQGNHDLFIPLVAVKAIFSQESQLGLRFTSPRPSKTPVRNIRKGHLSLVETQAPIEQSE